MIELCEHAGVYSFLQDEKNHIIKKQTKKGCCAHKPSLVKPLLLKLLFQASEVSCLRMGYQYLGTYRHLF
jgi:hypothetical protein